MSTVEHYPEIRSLSPAECEQLLQQHNVGRLAFTFRDRVDIQPLHYIYDDAWLYLRTSPGHKLDTVARHPWVAFEVDEVRGPFDWVSVVVYGTVYRIDADSDAPNPEAEARAVELLRKVVPEMFTARDPVPHRHVLLRIAVKEVAGRRASSSWERAEGRDTAAY